MKYKFIKGWKRWNTGDIIERYEYNRLPEDIKTSCLVLLQDQPEVKTEISTEPIVREIEIPKKPLPEERIESVSFKPINSDDTKFKKNTKN